MFLLFRFSLFVFFIKMFLFYFCSDFDDFFFSLTKSIEKMSGDVRCFRFPTSLSSCYRISFFQHP